MSLCILQVEHDLGSKWLIINAEKYKAEVNKYKNLKRSLSKRSEKQAEIRDNTAMMLNSGFHTYAYLILHTLYLGKALCSFLFCTACPDFYRHSRHAPDAVQVHHWILAVQPCMRMAI